MRNLHLVHSNTWFEHSSTHSPTAHDTGEAGDRPATLQPGRGERDSALRALDPAVQAMVEHVRIVAPLPHVIRARALARARAAIAALHR
jgi:hypothetical protein